MCHESETRDWRRALARQWRIVLTVVLTCGGLVLAEVEVYPRPGLSIRSSTAYSVTVIQEGQRYESFVYQIQAQETRDWRHNVCSFTTFSFSEPVVIEVKKLNGAWINSCRVYPSSYGITPELVGYNTVRFSVARPMKKMAVIFNDNWTTHPLLVFADPLETNAPQPGDADVIYFGPGVHDAGLIRPHGGQTVYLAGGAYVKGAIVALDMPNLTIRGRGILSQEDMAFHESHAVDLSGPGNRGCVVEGITLIQMAYFGVVCHGWDNHIRNVKIVGAWRFNNDGVSAPWGGTVEDCFLKCDDDAIKVYSSSSTVCRNVIWQMENGAVYQIGWNVPAESFGIHVYDDDIIRTEHRWDNPNNAIICAIHSGNGHLHDYLFENIRVENYNWCLFKIQLTPNKPGNPVAAPGQISNITIRDLVATDCHLECQGFIHGWNPEHTVSDVTFDRLVINGRMVESASEAMVDIDPATTSNIKFINTPQQEPRAWYPFEGDARDRQGRFHGRYDRVSFVTGILGAQAAHFDGVDGVLEIPNSVLDDFTISFWLRTDQAKRGSSRWRDGCTLIDGGDNGPAGGFGVSVLNGVLAFGAGHSDETMASETTVNDGLWHHIVVTRDGSAGMMTVYVDGVSEAAGVGPTGPLSVASNLSLGAMRTDENHFQGELDDLRFYNRVLGSAAVRGLYDVTPPQPDPADFAVAPVAVGTSTVTMQAVPGSDDSGGVEYRFDEMTAKTGASSSAWQTSPTYTDTGLEQYTTYEYRVTMRDAAGNETTASEPVEVRTNSSVRRRQADTK